MLNFGRYAGYDMQDIPTEYLESVAPFMTKEADKLTRELAGRSQSREFSPEPFSYRKFVRACRRGTGAEFLDSLKLNALGWDEWFEYVSSQSTNAVPANIARNFFREVGVPGF